MNISIGGSLLSEKAEPVTTVTRLPNIEMMS
jgi:hypothetical protein